MYLVELGCHYFVCIVKVKLRNSVGRSWLCFRAMLFVFGFSLGKRALKRAEEETGRSKIKISLSPACMSSEGDDDELMQWSSRGGW